MTVILVNELKVKDNFTEILTKENTMLKRPQRLPKEMLHTGPHLVEKRVQVGQEPVPGPQRHPGGLHRPWRPRARILNPVVVDIV